MDKETEIKHIRALSEGNTYFSEFFSKEDVNQMVQNIKNDFPIELHCTFNEKFATYKRLAEETAKNCDDAKFKMAVDIYKALDDCIPEELQQAILGFLGSPLRVIEAKAAADVPPTKEEVEYLIRQAKH